MIRNSETLIVTRATVILEPRFFRARTSCSFERRILDWLSDTVGRLDVRKWISVD